MTLLLLHAGLVQKCVLLGGDGGGHLLLKFLGFQGGCLFKVGIYSKVGS